VKTLVSLAAVVVGLVACGGPGASTAHARASAAPASAAPHAAVSPATAPRPSGPLFAVVESAAPGWVTQADTVAIVGLDGYARAKATFTPRKGPYVPMAATMPQSEAQVGTAGVYYADGNGVVRLLTPSGESEIVATFPMTPDQHELWYAVSPDGSRLLAGLLTLPAIVPPPPGTDLPPTMAGIWTFDLESANAGGPTSVLQHLESAEPPANAGEPLKPTFPVGWTQEGPVAMFGAPISTQNVWYGGPLFRIGPAGQTLDQVAGADCLAASILPSGVAACDTRNGTVTVRSYSGQVLWKPGVDGFSAKALKLAPAGDAITDGRHAATTNGLVTLPPGFVAQGWLDSRTVVGRQPDGNLSYIRLDSPQTVHDLGFMGDFVGTLPGI
jgi:hypothetical protein